MFCWLIIKEQEQEVIGQSVVVLLTNSGARAQGYIGQSVVVLLTNSVVGVDSVDGVI